MLPRKWPLSLLLLFFILLLGTTQVSAQVEPDTVKRKRELPTGPPGQLPPQQVPPRTQPPVTTRPAPVQQQSVLQERPSVMERLYWGGGFGLGFGTFTNVSLSPILGYMVTDKFWSGVGVIYQYTGSRGVNYQDYGGKAFAQLEFLNLEESFLRGRLVAHAEYDVLNIQYTNPMNGGKMRSVEGFPLAGAAYRQPIGGRATADLYVLYNFSDSALNPYSNPVIRFGINIPFR